MGLFCFGRINTKKDGFVIQGIYCKRSCIGGLVRNLKTESRPNILNGEYGKRTRGPNADVSSVRIKKKII